MPPSPALRCSPGREVRSENHRRGRSLESALPLREKDDDLALFNEMQNRERDNFLLDKSDDLDDSLSTKLKCFSDIKLGISIPVRGESSELLNADSEKNDYDWLLTPPETPLFPSLDDETPSASLASRGRPQTQPISIPRSSAMEKSYRTSRSSASPHRLSPSPRSGSNTFQSRGRPSSAPHTSPSPIQRPASPSQRPSTPPTKPSTPTHRSPTPTTRRVSTGSSGIVASSRRGTSPIKTSRGNSASPKIRAWQSTIPGFSSDAPPNLRTSLADRPASYVRGSSPASRNGKDTSSNFRRQSMSPTASRSGSSSFGNDRDRFSSRSKGSVASSGDDDVDSLQSLPVSISDHSAVRRAGAFPNSRTPSFSRKPSKTPSSSSAPKRSFDTVLRQMDNRKSPQNMFRPLLSSVPSTTFYVGKTSSTHRPTVSMNSSVTTSSNASSELGASVALDTEVSDHDQDDMGGDWGKAPHPDAQDEIFVFDKVDEMNGDVNNEVNDGKNTGYADIDRTTTTEVGESEKFSGLMSATVVESAASENVNVENDFEELDGHGRITYCSICGSKFHVIEPMEGNEGLCPDCSVKSGSLTPAAWEHPVVHSHNTSVNTEVALRENKSFSALEHEAEVAEVQGITSRNETVLVQHDENVKQDHSCNIEEAQSYLHGSSSAQIMLDGGEQHFVQPTVGSIQSNYVDVDQQFHPSLKVDVSEGAGISLLLKRSSSSKWPVVQGRTFAATNINCDDPSYARDSINSMRSSGGLGSASASSSVDWSSSRQTDVRVQRQLSGKKLDLDNFRHDSSTKLQRTGSSSSGISNPAYQALLLTKGTSEEKFDASVGSMDHETVEETRLLSDEQDTYLSNEKSCESDSSFVRAAVNEADKLDFSESCRVVDASGLELSSHTNCIQLEDASVAAVSNDEDCVSSSIAEEFPNCTGGTSDIEISTTTPEPLSIEDNATLNSDCAIEIVEAPAYNSSAMISGELENGGDSIPGSHVESVISPNSAVDESLEPAVPATSEKDLDIPSSESDILNHANGIPEESTVTMEGQGGQQARSLTLEEATDTILFCSSIIHNLAYQAATIGMEKESSVHPELEGCRPTVTLLGKPSSERKEPRGRSGNKRTLKSQKARQRRVEADVKTPSTKTEIDVKTDESLVHDTEAPHKVDSSRPLKLESKCNCIIM
ncbi:mucin-12-like [Telopea speciosissima]|uniref:mucin-12-like n=1 Tax=Telopea speciosissima TaxID=54955 RepID=UPI001CC53E5C|nr:mucin-12-like [Telopea speciosissima]